jgi:hypothetical protein
MDSTGDRPLSGFWVVLALFISARLMLLVIWPPETLTLYGDYDYYFRLAALERSGQLPFVHYWSEYPPVFPWLNLVLYELSGGSFKNYVVLTRLVLLAFEAGSLYLLYRIAVDSRGPDQAMQITWVYLALTVPVFIWLGSFEAITACLVLLALFTLKRGRPWITGLIIGLGAMVKWLPLLLLAAVGRQRGPRAGLVSGLAALLVCLVVLGPLAWFSPDYTLASLKAQVGKSSWQTLWALLDGNLANTGSFGPLSDRFDPARAGVPLHNPSRLPWWLTAIPFAGAGLFALTRPRRRQIDDHLVFSALAFILFCLWSKGWSPQWQMFLIPLLLLSLPLRRAVLVVLALGFINVLEWPAILSRGLTQLLPLTVIARSLIWVVLAWELYQRLAHPPSAIGAADGPAS